VSAVNAESLKTVSFQRQIEKRFAYCESILGDVPDFCPPCEVKQNCSTCDDLLGCLLDAEHFCRSGTHHLIEVLANTYVKKTHRFRCDNLIQSDCCTICTELGFLLILVETVDSLVCACTAIR
jgi:hypothetical protein